MAIFLTLTGADDFSMNFFILLIICLLLSIIYQLNDFRKENTAIMPAIDDLKAAVTNLQSTAADGFAAQEAAFAELAADIEGISDAEDIEAETARVAAVATELGTASGAFAQRMRDLIPTEQPPADPPEEPPTEPI